MSRIPWWAFLAGQVIYHHPLLVPVWLSGGIGLLRGRNPLGVAWLVMFAFLLIVGSKIYYISPVYPTLFGAGGVALEGLMRRRPWARRVSVAVLATTGVALAPLSVPMLPIAQVDEYAAAATLGLAGQLHEVTGVLHDMFGWRQQALAVYAAALSLPVEEQVDLALLAGNYGEAGALELYAPRPGLFPVVSPHLSYYLWGWSELEHPRFVAVGISDTLLLRVFREVRQLGTARGSPDALPWERDLPIWLCQEPLFPLEDVWRQMGLQL